jgi:hypothetical protein
MTFLMKPLVRVRPLLNVLTLSPVGAQGASGSRGLVDKASCEGNT